MIIFKGNRKQLKQFMARFPKKESISSVLDQLARDKQQSILFEQENNKYAIEKPQS